MKETVTSLAHVYQCAIALHCLPSPTPLYVHHAPLGVPLGGFSHARKRTNASIGAKAARSILRSLPSLPFPSLPSAMQQCSAANTLEDAIPPTCTNAHQHTSTPACIRSCQGHTLSRCGQHAIARLAVGLGHCGDWRCPSGERKGWRTDVPVRFVV